MNFTMIKSNSKNQNIVCEQQAKFVQDRIISVEKNFAELCAVFAAYTRKTAGLRDKGDDLAKTIKQYAEEEAVNKTLKTSLISFASILLGVGDYRDAQVQRIENKVVAELSQYAGICKHTKEEVKTTLIAREREVARKRALDRVRERNPRNRQQISVAETELAKASADVSRAIKCLEEQMDMFEKKKLHDIRELFLNYVTIELGFHAKAVELYTKAYQDIAEIDENEDLEEFRNTFHVPESVSRLDTVKRTSFPHSFSLGIFSKSSTLTSKETSGNTQSGSADCIHEFVEESSSPLTSEDEIPISRRHH